jgi:formate dehydrogenase iron-sulfur subunit
MAILTDVTRCTGCEACVTACQEHNDLPRERAWRWLHRIDDLSHARWTTLRRLRDDRFVRRQCRHCIDPECVSVCIVGALQKTKEGPVTYDRDLCIGCRYCMIACPWEIPRYSWEETVPFIQKCDLCHDRVTKEGRVPACVEACPEEATIFGERQELLDEAHRRLEQEPDRYIQKVWGEHEVGGTSVLYISDVDLNLTDLDAPVGDHDPLPHRTTRILHQMPLAFLGMAGVMYGLHWIIRRRQQRLAEGSAAATPDPAEETS